MNKQDGDMISFLRNQFEKFELNFQEGISEVIDNFENNKEQFKAQIENWKQELDEHIAKGENKAKEIKAGFESLQVQLNLGRAEGKEMMEEQSKKIEAAMHEIYSNLKEDGNKNFKHSLEVFDRQSAAFKTSIEIARLQIALGKMEAGEELESAKKEIREKMEDLKTQFADGQQFAIKSILEWQNENIKRMEKFRDWTQSFLNRK